jgi:(+)-trans-carveol dehydrogenase
VSHHRNHGKEALIVELMRTLALELAPDMIRVNSVHTTTVDTDMVQNDAMYALFAPDLAEQDRTRGRLTERFQAINALPIPWVKPWIRGLMSKDR